MPVLVARLPLGLVCRRDKVWQCKPHLLESAHQTCPPFTKNHLSLLSQCSSCPLGHPLIYAFCLARASASFRALAQCLKLKSSGRSSVTEPSTLGTAQQPQKQRNIHLARNPASFPVAWDPPTRAFLGVPLPSDLHGLAEQRSSSKSARVGPPLSEQPPSFSPQRVYYLRAGSLPSTVASRIQLFEPEFLPAVALFKGTVSR